MSDDVNEVARLLDSLGIYHSEPIGAHEIRWRDESGVLWAYYGELYGSRDSRLCAYGISPEEAVRKALAQ